MLVGIDQRKYQFDHQRTQDYRCRVLKGQVPDVMQLLFGTSFCVHGCKWNVAW